MTPSFHHIDATSPFTGTLQTAETFHLDALGVKRHRISRLVVSGS